MNHKQISKLIKRCVAAKKSLFVWGKPGIGKSFAVAKIAKELATEADKEFSLNTFSENQYSLIDIRASQLDPSDLRGLMIIREGKTVYALPEWLPTKGQGILFFDELNLAYPSVQAACYQLILDRRLGTYQLPDGFSIIAAGNTADDKANVYEMPAPLCNRFIHNTLDIPTVEDWSDWASANGVESNIIGFVNLKPSAMYSFDPKHKDKAFSTPRTLAFLSDMIKGVTDMKDISEFAESTIGEGLAKEFVAFVKLGSKINIDEILEHPEKIEKLTSIDLKYLAISAIADYYKNDKDKIMVPMLKCALHVEPEFARLMIRMCKLHNETYFTKEITRGNKDAVATWKDVTAKLSKYIL